jgi:hypothetical protein
VSTRTHELTVAVVIDTQALLDWQFFCNPVCAGWSLPGASRWSWLATPAMRAELAHVLARGFPARWTTPVERVLAFFDDHATVVEAPTCGVVGLGMLRCSDPDDQKFIDLALALRPAMLVSRDRAVLKLARRASAHGVAILPPHRWQVIEAACAMPP